MKANQDIRDKMLFNKLRHWEVAQKIGITNSYFSVWLRTPLDEERKELVMKAIDSLSKDKNKIDSF